MQPGPTARSPLLAIALGGIGSVALLLMAAAAVTVSRRRGRRQMSLLAPRPAATPEAGSSPDLVPGPPGKHRAPPQPGAVTQLRRVGRLVVA